MKTKKEDKPSNPSAFPLNGYDNGMTLRDYFASNALIGAISNETVRLRLSEKANEMLDRGLSLKDMGKEIGFVPNNDKIVQIKGKQNRAPNPEYQPFVQDFVRNSPFGKGWAEVGDLENTGLTKHPSGKYVSGAEANAMMQRHFGSTNTGNTENPWQYANRIRRYDPDMLSDTDKAFLTDWEAGNFAEGGSVNIPGNRPLTQSDLHAMIAALETQANA